MIARFGLITFLALAASPASADGAQVFLDLFRQTCAKSLTTPAAFTAAVKAAGFTLLGDLSKLPDGDERKAWNDIVYWSRGDQDSQVTVTMSVHGSLAHHILNCLIYAPPHSGLTLEVASAAIRAAMNLGEPTGTAAGGGEQDSDASWLLGSGDDEQRIGVTVPGPNGVGPPSIAVITQAHGD
jgi:hypothetical protein